MIDPRNITNYYRTTNELEEFLLFCIFVQGKKSQQTADKLEQFLELGCRDYGNMSPFQLIRVLLDNDELDRYLRHCKFGCYRNLNKGLKELVEADLDLRTCTTNELEAIHGIGLKSSRFFIMHSRENQRIATLDTHILKWLREKGYDAPKSTPTSIGLYYKLEDAFLAECDKTGYSPADFDLMIWKERQVQ